MVIYKKGFFLMTKSLTHPQILGPNAINRKTSRLVGTKAIGRSDISISLKASVNRHSGNSVMLEIAGTCCK